MAKESKDLQRLAVCKGRGSSTVRLLEADEFLALARTATAALEWPTRESCNAQDWSLEQIKLWCSQWSPLFKNDSAALWVDDRCGISIAYDEAMQFLDELWFPSADDLFIISSDGLAVLFIDHEEQISLHQPKLLAGG